MFEILAEAGALDDLERQLRLADEVVRHKLIRLPDREAAAAACWARQPGRYGRLAEESLECPDNTVTLVGNVTRDPELRFTPAARRSPPSASPSTAAVADADGRVGGADLLLRRHVLGPDGRERVRSRCRRAPRVVVTGRLEQRSWETQDGEKRSKVEIVGRRDRPEPALGDRARSRRTSGASRGEGGAAAAQVAERGADAGPPSLRTTRSPSDGQEGAPRRRTRTTLAGARRRRASSSRSASSYVDYKDVNLLRRFMSDRAKIRARRVTGNDAQQQREVARAIKNAREMALLPYTNRVTTQRTSRDRGPGGAGPGRWAAAASGRPAADAGGDGIDATRCPSSTEDVLLDDVAGRRRGRRG